MNIFADITLGSPAADCAKFGICSLELLPPEHWESFKPLHSRQVKAIISISGESCLLFRFPYDGMMSDTRKQFFPSEGFRIDSAKVIPSEITQILNLPQNAVIEAGLYPVVEFRDAFTVKITTSIGQDLSSTRIYATTG